MIQTGVELAIKHINDAGGIFGRPVELVTGDTQVDTVQGVEEARRLVEVEGVHAIVGPLSSTVTIAVAESVTGPAGVPTISPSATSPAVSVAEDDGYLFRSTISDAAQGVILAALAADEGYDNVGVIFRNDAYGQGLADAFEAAFGGSVTSASIEQGAASYLSELQSAADGDAPVLVVHPMREDRAAQPHDHPAQHEALHAEADRVLARRPRRVLVLADRPQHPAPRRPCHPPQGHSPAGRQLLRPPRL